MNKMPGMIARTVLGQVPSACRLVTDLVAQDIAQLMRARETRDKTISNGTTA
jgi:hypothetical protein